MHAQLELGDEASKMFESIDLNYDTKRYLNFRLKQVTLHMKEGKDKEWVENKYFNIEKCKEDFFEVG